LLKHVRFPAIHTLDASKTPKAGDARMTAPVLASADVVKVTRQIEAIEATQSSKAKHPTKAGAKTHVARAQAQPTVASSPKQTITAAPPQIGAAIVAAPTAACLSQSALASRTKTAQPNIGRLEKGGSLPSVRTLQRIAKATAHKLVISFIPT
jgi:ribosome-binding protein aMBF1 (putative translation factor)